jgi:hypothetical protein
MIEIVVLGFWSLLCLVFVCWALLGSPHNQDEWTHRWSVIKGWFA